MIWPPNLGTRPGTRPQGHLGTNLGTRRNPLKTKARTIPGQNHSNPGTNRPPLGGRCPDARSGIQE